MGAVEEAQTALSDDIGRVRCPGGIKEDPGNLINPVPGAVGQAHDRIPGDHFIQESQGGELAKHIVEFMATT